MKHKSRILVVSLSLFLSLGALLALFLLAAGGNRDPGGDTVREGYLLTIDGYGVTEEEFNMFLLDQKAVTANYFWTNYQVQPDADFWTTEVGGETPVDYAKQRALDALIKARVEFILASERDILQYKDYDALMEGMEAENADRAQKLAAGEVFYGLTEFSPFTYYQYLNTNIRSELEYAQRELSQPTEEELRQLYDANLETFSKGVVYEYEIVRADGTRETVTQSTLEIGKEDTTTEDLIFGYFESMEAGEKVEAYDYRGETVDITLLSRTPQGYLSFEEAEESLRVFFARNELTELIKSRVSAARVEIDQDRYDAIMMP